MQPLPTDILSAADSYDQGRVTRDEAMLKIIGAITDTTVAVAILEQMSSEWRHRIWEEVEASPTNEQDWNSQRMFVMGTYIGEGAVEHAQQQNRASLERFRLGVECLRKLNRST